MQVTRWTNDAAHVAALVLMCVGSWLALNGHPMPGLGVEGLAVALLAILHALEAYAAARKSVQDVERLAKAEKALEALTTAHGETAKNAEAALSGLRTLNAPPRRPGGY